MKKILVLFLGKTGAGPVYTYEIACALSQYNKIMIILSSYIDNKNDWDREARHNKNLNIKYIRTYNSKLGFFLAFFNIFWFIRFIKMINNYNPDLVYSTWAHYWDPMIYPFLKCNLKVKTIHDVEFKRGETGISFRLLYYFSFRHADKYIILSKKYERTLEKKGIDKNNIMVIPNKRFSFYKSGVNEKFIFHNRILFFGRIVKYKGLDVLLDAMKIIVKKMPDIKLVIAGDGDVSEYKNNLDLLKDNIELFNYWIPNEDVKKYFNEIDILVLPYTEATQSGVIPIAYSFYKPVIVSDVGALSEQIDNEKTGFLIDPNDPVILADTIQKLMNSPNSIFKMNRNCKDYYDSWKVSDTSIKQILDLLET
jgi:glycosyltransferase involved in cell wall biosynthesis